MGLDALIDQLWAAAEAYYQGKNDVFLTDEEYDEKIEELAKRIQSGETASDQEKAEKLISGFISGDFVTENSFTSVPMLSQDKAKTKDEVKEFLVKISNNGAEKIKLQAKLDGFSLAATYISGKLSDLRLRGSGGIGQSIFSKFSKDEILKTFKGIPLVLSGKFEGETLEARGEALISYNNFSEINRMRINDNLDPYSHPRTAAFQLASKNYSGVNLNFFTWQVLSENNYGYSHQDLESTGLISVDDIFPNHLSSVLDISSENSIEEIMETIQHFGDERENLEFPTDGIVIKPKNEDELNKKLGFTSHHPLSQIAFKYPGVTEVGTVISTEVKIWGDGELYGQVVIDPIKVGGMTAKTLNLETSSKLFELAIVPGDRVVVELYHDVKLRIKTTLESKAQLKLPESCPICFMGLEKILCPPDLKKGIYSNYTKMICTNELCRGRQEALATKVFKNSCDLEGRAKSFVNGMTDKTAIQLIPENGVWLDVFEADQSQIEKCKTPSGSLIVPSNVPKIKKNLSEAIPRITPELILAGSGIERLTAKRSIELIKNFGSIENILLTDPEKLTELLNTDDYTEKTYKEKVSGEKILTKMRNNEIIKRAISKGYVK